MHILTANILVVLHMSFVAFMSLGFIWALVSGRVAGTIWGYIYFVAFLLTAMQQIIFKGCVLTIFERNVRKKVDPDLQYRDTFLSQYLPFLVGVKLGQRTVTALHLSIAMSLGIYIAFFRG